MTAIINELEDAAEAAAVAAEASFRDPDASWSDRSMAVLRERRAVDAYYAACREEPAS